jgi:hypothetical protein
MRAARRLLSVMLVALGWSAAGCSSAEVAPGANVRTLYVSPETAECVGVGPQTCLLVREAPTAAWELFYDRIEGFTHVPGTAYTLEVEVTAVPDPPADASSLRYRLLRVLGARPG